MGLSSLLYTSSPLLKLDLASSFTDEVVCNPEGISVDFKQ